MPFTVEKTLLPGVVLVKPGVFGDEPGISWDKGIDGPDVEKILSKKD